MCSIVKTYCALCGKKEGMNRIKELFENKKKDICNIYFTAGFPDLHDTEKIILTLEKAGADLIEIGMPYSDPLADVELVFETRGVR